jgi:hypothetical protein
MLATVYRLHTAEYSHDGSLLLLQVILALMTEGIARGSSIIPGRQHEPACQSMSWQIFDVPSLSHRYANLPVLSVACVFLLSSKPFLKR